MKEQSQRGEAYRELMSGCLEAADCILANLGDWEGEACEAAQRAQADEAYDAVMRSHLADAIYAEVTAASAAIRKERDTYRKAYAHVDSVLNQVKEQRDAARNRLKPFAEAAAVIDQNDAADGYGPEHDCVHFRYRNSYSVITLGDCRRAREILQREGKK